MVILEIKREIGDNILLNRKPFDEVWTSPQKINKI
jgi:hypothetical protein